MGNCYNYTPILPAEASCIIAHLFVELAPPCERCGEDALTITGNNRNRKQRNAFCYGGWV